MAGGLLATLTAAIDELADIDLDGVDDTDLHDAAVGLGALSSRLEAQWCRLIRRWDNRQIWADNGSEAPVSPGKPTGGTRGRPPRRPGP